VIHGMLECELGVKFIAPVGKDVFSVGTHPIRKEIKMKTVMRLASCFFLSTFLWTNWNSCPLSHSILAQVTPGSTVPRDPYIEALLDKANACCLAYYKEFRQFVVEEKQIQKRYDRKGKVIKQRTIVSDYYVVSLPSNPQEAIEFMDQGIQAGTGRRHFAE